MGAIGSIVGGIGSAIIGNKSAKKAAKRQAAATDRATEASLKGFNFLKDSELVTDAQGQGLEAQGLVSGLLGLGGDPAAAEEAFRRFQDSTGFQFRLGRGQEAITGSRAARGLLNSGGTLKALNEFGQGIGSQEFNNFLAQVQGVQNTGLNAAFNVASSGNSGGANAANATLIGARRENAIRRRGTEDVVSGLGAAFGGLSEFRGFGGGGAPLNAIPSLGPINTGNASGFPFFG